MVDLRFLVNSHHIKVALEILDFNILVVISLYVVPRQAV